ncbi:DCP1B enzyme, partial [Alaudala cheleensis]|nr:DCP1B enzyme [Alaudala cheleensis]
LGRGLDISLAALRQHDPYISGIVDVASQVALYTFGHRASQWEKTDVEGTLFVYTRSASPRHGFTIMNRLSMENRTEPITKDLDFQLQDPFLLYRNARLSIYGIWFYDKEECQRIAELMKNLTQQEQFKAQQGSGAGLSPMIMNSANNKEVDILRMLTKAKDEYTKCKTCSEPKQITSSSAIYNNPNLIKPIPVKPSENQQQRLSQQSKGVDTEPQHLSLTALFGRQDKAEEAAQDSVPGRPGAVRSLSYEEPGRHSPGTERQLCPAIQKLMVRGSELAALAELPESRPAEQPVREAVAGLFPAGPARGLPAAQDSAGAQSLLHKLHSQAGAAVEPSAAAAGNPPAPVFSGTAAPGAAPANNLSQPPLVYFNGSLPAQPLEPQLAKEQSKLPRQPLPLSGNQAANSGVISPQELLKKLQIVQQEQQLHVSSRPTLAAKFPVVTQSTNSLKPLDSWIEKAPGTEKQSTLFQVMSPQHIGATVSPTLLMSPMVFSQPTPAAPQAESGRLAAASAEPAASPGSLLLPLPAPEPALAGSSSISKLQLQETLLHLIQNDDNFLNIIYEAYLFSVRKAAMKKSM